MTPNRMERIAPGLNMSVLELLGFEAEAWRALKKSGVDYVSAITKKNRADAVWRSRPVP